MKNWFTIKQLNKNVWGIGEFGCDEEVVSYLILGTDSALLIDSGMGIFDIKSAVQKIAKDLPILLINTHCHFDHVGGNHSFNNILLFENAFSKSVSKNGISNKEILSYTPIDDLKDVVDINKYSIQNFEYTKLVQNGDIIDLKPFKFHVVHTPGHSPDSICLYEPSKGWLFSGDTLYDGPIYLQLKESNIDEYVKSIDSISNLKGLSEIFPGHNGFSLNPNIILKIKDGLKNNNLKSTKTIELGGRLKILL